MSYDHAAVLSVYRGSNGEETKALYVALESRGDLGVIAMNLFRACKASERAKLYRGRYRGEAYDKKEWSIDNLCKVLASQKAAGLGGCGISWGWKIDERLKARDDPHHHVVYVDLPTGQVSFHSSYRGNGPDYAGEWDGAPGQGPSRICLWVAQILERVPA